QSRAENVYRKGCEHPLKGVSVCWEASADPVADVSPFPEVHLLPLASMNNGQESVLVDTTRAIYRQLAPSNLAQRIVMEWEPAFSLEDAISAGWPRNDWPLILWISPRQFRTGSATSKGVVDWDVYLIKGDKSNSGRLLKTMRVRVESKPEWERINKDYAGLVAGTLSGMARVATVSNQSAAGLMVGGAMMSPYEPPQSGRSLDLMTELAVRQVIFLAQYPVEELQPVQQRTLLQKVLQVHPSSGPTAAPEEKSGWLQQFFH
ncbi:MAG: hypothetical protein HQL50_15420, partial [Magnetococcales bacterium]|nr:hypothetical protein [Magnetococcales bacterium]